MPKLKVSLPSYRRHKASGQAVVTLGGRDHYLGPWDSAESRAAYDRVLHEWLAAGRPAGGAVAITPPSTGAGPVLGVQAAPPSAPAAVAAGSNVTIAQLLVAYLREAEQLYVKNGEPTSHLHNVKDALKPLGESYADEVVYRFGPLKLKAVREQFVARGLSRSTVNKHVGTIKRVFKWGTENELVPAGTYHALQAVAGLRRGRSAAKDGPAVRPVAAEHVAAVLLHVSAPVAAMIRLQELTGMRSGEVTRIRGCDLDTRGAVWTYTPATHKTEHHGIERPIYLGPKAQDVLRPFLRADLAAYVFDPRDAVEAQRAARRAARRTPATPSQAARRPKRSPRAAAGARYTTESYRRAVARACRRADALARRAKKKVAEADGSAAPSAGSAKAAEVFVPVWHPHQLRHNAATRLRREFGIEAARVILGHRSAAVTEIYAEIDHGRAADIMGRVG